MARALDKAKKDYYKRKAKWEMPGWSLGVISIIILIIGIISKTKIIAAIGILIFPIAVWLVVIGMFARYYLFRK